MKQIIRGYYLVCSQMYKPDGAPEALSLGPPSLKINNLRYRETGPTFLLKRS